MKKIEGKREKFDWEKREGGLEWYFLQRLVFGHRNGNRGVREVQLLTVSPQRTLPGSCFLSLSLSLSPSST